MVNFLNKLLSLAPKGLVAEISFHPSQTCPECGSQLCTEKGKENWSCPNPDCPAQVRRNLVHWCSPEAMNIPGIDEQMVALLVERGLVRDVAELYRVKLGELAGLPGVDSTAAQRLFDGIMASKARGAYCVLRGLNIPLMGEKECKSLAEKFSTVDIALSSGVSRLTEAGLDEAAAQSIVRWYGDGINRKLIKRLEKFGVDLKAG